MKRPFQSFLGVDLGGGKGKTTAVARLRWQDETLEVAEATTSVDGEPWHDEKLIEYLKLHAEGTVLAIDAPLTVTACVRCREPVCPGMGVCHDEAIVWFRTEGAALAASADPPEAPRRRPLFTPYTQRATEVWIHRRGGILPRETLGQGMGPLTARAAHLTRALRPQFVLNRNLLEVYPKATLQKLWGAAVARSYKREVDTWETRAGVLESLSQVVFGRSSRLARETVLSNDHCFDAVICAYTAFLWARDGWTMPEEGRAVFEVDGWIWAPP
jgi:predicted nuclease with RNAse H fold